uniref:Uncharacterized protein n=1 Tax=Helianthus annuus TaxID=4232 RepID=A0A251TWN0_HELAN
MCFVISRVCLWSFVSVKTLIDRRNRQKFFTIWLIVPHNLQSFNMHPLHNSPSFLKLIDEDDPIFLVKSFFQTPSPTRNY